MVDLPCHPHTDLFFVATTLTCLPRPESPLGNELGGMFVALVVNPPSHDSNRVRNLHRRLYQPSSALALFGSQTARMRCMSLSSRALNFQRPPRAAAAAALTAEQIRTRRHTTQSRRGEAACRRALVRNQDKGTTKMSGFEACGWSYVEKRAFRRPGGYKAREKTTLEFAKRKTPKSTRTTRKQIDYPLVSKRGGGWCPRQHRRSDLSLGLPPSPSVTQSSQKLFN